MAIGHSFRFAFLAAALAAVTAAQAQTSPQPYPESLVFYEDPGSDGSAALAVSPGNIGQLTLSPGTMGVLSLTGAQVQGITQSSAVGEVAGTVASTRGARGNYRALSVDMPVIFLFGRAQEAEAIPVDVERVSLGGGFTITTTADRFTNQGGSLTVSDLTIEAKQGQIFGKIVGTNGVGEHTTALWTYDTPNNLTLAPETTCRLDSMCTTTASALMSTGNLRLTAEAFDLFSRSLALTTAGVAALSSVQDFGTITTTVPEPSTYLLMGLGLVGVGLMRQRRPTTL